MSLLSPQVGIVAQPGIPGKTPIEGLFGKLTVASGVFLAVLQVSCLIFSALMPPDYWLEENAIKSLASTGDACHQES